jgi:membrane associated rhomboid family serine protease
LGIGVVIAETTDMSCFEGACGFFAFFAGLFGMLAGAVLGAILAVWLTNRRRFARTV